jgi:hypothetical protein
MSRPRSITASPISIYRQTVGRGRVLRCDGSPVMLENHVILEEVRFPAIAANLFEEN